MCRPWYTNQTTTARSPDDFFTNPAAIAAYLSNAQAVMNRVNSVTKLAYNADPTIMAWNLMNEPRCEYANSGCDASTVQVYQFAHPFFCEQQCMTAAWQPVDTCPDRAMNHGMRAAVQLPRRLLSTVSSRCWCRQASAVSVKPLDRLVPT